MQEISTRIILLANANLAFNTNNAIALVTLLALGNGTIVVKTIPLYRYKKRHVQGFYDK